MVVSKKGITISFIRAEIILLVMKEVVLEEEREVMKYELRREITFHCKTRQGIK